MCAGMLLLVQLWATTNGVHVDSTCIHCGGDVYTHAHEHTFYSVFSSIILYILKSKHKVVIIEYMTRSTSCSAVRLLQVFSI